MANVTKVIKTPLTELRYLHVEGQGKLKYDPENKLDKNDPHSYQYTAMAVLTESQANELNKEFRAFWTANRPAGATKQKYELIKPLMKDTGKKDEDGDPILEQVVNDKGEKLFTLQFKTNTVWPDGSPNPVKILRANGNPLNLGGKRIGDGSIGVIHGKLGINAFKGNEGLLAFLTAVQLKKFVPFEEEVQAEDLGEDEGLDDIELDAADITHQDGPGV